MKRKANRLTSDHLNFQQRLIEGLFVVSIAFSVFLIIAFVTYRPFPLIPLLASNIEGPVGVIVAGFFLNSFGYLAYLFPCLLILLSWMRFKNSGTASESIHYPFLLVRGLGFIAIFVSACGIMSGVEAHYNYLHHNRMLHHTKGGYLGQIIAAALIAQFNLVGTFLFLSALLSAGMTLVTGLSWLQIAHRPIRLLGKLCKEVLFKVAQTWQIRRKAARTAALQLVSTQLDEEIKPIIKKCSEIKSVKLIEQSVASKVATTPAISKPVITQPARPVLVEPVHTNESLPDLKCLDQPAPAAQEGYSKAELEQLSREVELRLKDFGIEVQVSGVYPGPVITRFEMKLAPGIKVSRITSLAKDLARSLSVISVRIVEVIPGKSVVGLEVPNRHREIVRLSEILSSKNYQQASSSLSLALGKDIAGHAVVVDLSKMPHLLVAGTTGSGKSVGLNAMLLSILFKATPRKVRLIMIDPKMLELAIYEGIPHLLAPVVTDMKEAANALRWCVAEMERRYKLMAHLGVRNLASYNQKVFDAIEKGKPLLDPLWQPTQTETAEPLAELPYVIVLIDEFADMMMVVGKKVEELIARIAQKARAAGIHLILATQRPSVDVITGLIKANIPTRIAFQVSSKIDSRTILDQQGAEQLLGHGDMLYLAPGTGSPIRVHGAFVADHEVHKVADSLKKLGPPDYKLSITAYGDENGEAGSGTGGNPNGEQDPLYDQAVQIVIQTRRASISSVQRRLKIGYNRAARIMEDMEQAGLVSSMESNGNREVLIPDRENE